jgi:galactarate dehydratase
MNSSIESTLIKTSPADNVGIVTHPAGLARGTTVLDNVVLVQDIPMGHKVALKELPQGSAVIRYGQVIGTTTGAIPQGAWLNETNITMPPPPDLNDIEYKPHPVPVVEPLTGYTFEGYRNANGSVGTKNVLGITISVQCVAGMTNYITQRRRRGHVQPQLWLRHCH